MTRLTRREKDALLLLHVLGVAVALGEKLPEVVLDTYLQIEGRPPAKSRR